MTSGRSALGWLALMCGATAAAAILALRADTGAASYGVAAAAVCAGVALAWRLGSLGAQGATSLSQTGEAHQVLQKLADEGRKLAIYDRVTGLYAYWYLQMRAEEEMSRAGRYQKPLSVVSFWCSTKEAIERATATLAGTLRATDLAAYLGNGHFVVLLPETNAEGAAIVVERVRERVGGDISGVAVQYPEDGQTLNDLIETANVIDRVLSRAKERESNAA
jgi:PleD family two-component response regulator